MKKEIKEFVTLQLQNYAVEITKDDLYFFKKEVISEVKNELNKINKRVEELEKGLDNIRNFISMS